VAAKSRRAKEVFVSHASGDRKFVQRLIRIFKKNKVGYWYSERHIPGATEWHDEIGRALDRCDWFVIVLSPKSVKSIWVKRELLYALRQNSYRGRVVPILIRKCNHDQLSWTLADIEMIDFRRSFEAGCKSLLKTLGFGIKPT
jgi:hypothetical protein